MADSPLSNIKLKLVNTIDAAMEFKRWLGERRAVLGVDTESSGLHPEKDRLRLVQIGDRDTGWAIPWELWGGVALEALNNYTGEWVAHNASFDCRFLQIHAGWKPPWDRIHDTMTQAHIVDPGRPKGLKPLADRLVDSQATVGAQVLTQAMYDNNWDWGSVPVDTPAYWGYGALDPLLTCRIHEKMYPLVEDVPAYALEMSAVRICAGMMLRGMKVDVEHCTTKALELREWVLEARQWALDEFNIKNVTSNKQIIDRLVADGVELTKMTESGKSLSLDKDVLEAIKDRHPLANLVRKVRRAEKTCGTYLDNMVELADANGYVHAQINPLGAVTGRMSIQDPAWQTLYRDDKVVRNGVIPSEGNSLVAIDADQIEARLMAHFSGDQGLIDAFKGPDDFFCTIGSEIFQDTIKKGDFRRTLTKNTVYGKCYCAGPDKLAETAHISQETAHSVFNRFDYLYPGVKEYAEGIIRDGEAAYAAGEVPYVETPYGRRIPVFGSKIYPLVNYSVQGPAAEVLKRGMADLEAKGLSDYLVLPVHDELVLDAPKDIANDVLHEVEEILTDRTTFKVDLTWSGEIYEDRWTTKA